MPLSRSIFHAITVKGYTWTPSDTRRDPEVDERSAERFLARFGDRLDFRGNEILDVGCDAGDLAAVLARDGARHVTGIELHTVDENHRVLAERYGSTVADRVELLRTSGDMEELGDRQFDLVFSKEAMEHYADPESFVPQMARRVRPGGAMVIGFGPLWKAFDGGHMDYMTKVPWAHLIFPERVIMAERRRFRPEEHAERFEDIRGGLNKMTLERFEAIMASSGFTPEFVKPLREHFTNNVWGIWRNPAPVQSPDRADSPAGADATL